MTARTDSPKSTTSYRSWLPRLSSAVMVDLRLWMLGFGLLIGLAFPFVVLLLGVPRDLALRPSFFAATLIAGLVVAEVNHLLARAVVGVRLRSLAGGIQRVERSLVDASHSGDWAGCDPTECIVPVDSTDELGQVAESFNRLVAGLSTSHRVSDGITSLSQAFAAHLELGALAEATLRELSVRTSCDAAGLLVVRNGRVDVAGSSGIRNAEALVSAEAVAVLNAAMPGLAVALNNALNQQRVATMDPLTGVYNRRFGLE